MNHLPTEVVQGYFVTNGCAAWPMYIVYFTRYIMKFMIYSVGFYKNVFLSYLLFLLRNTKQIKNNCQGCLLLYSPWCKNIIYLYWILHCTLQTVLLTYWCSIHTNKHYVIIGIANKLTNTYNVLKKLIEKLRNNTEIIDVIIIFVVLLSR